MNLCVPVRAQNQNARRILFFIEDSWAFGNIHNALRKCLYPEYDCDVACWKTNYNYETMRYLVDKYDLFVSVPHGVCFLHEYFGVPNEKLVGIAHGDRDIYSCTEPAKENKSYIGSPKHFSDLRGYAVISKKLMTTSFAFGVPRLPDILPIGLYTRDYIRPMSTEIKTLGYMGAIERFDNHGFDFKRGKLAMVVAEKTGLTFNAPHTRNEIHYLGSNRVYREMDLLMFCSLQEGLPCTAQEALAAGVPVLGTAAGLFEEWAAEGGGVVLPYEEDAFIEQAVAVIRLLQQDHSKYQKMHAAAIATSQKYDWAVLKKTWVDYFDKLLGVPERAQ